jgi:hypothetical protein
MINSIRKHISNFWGWSTKRKIVVIESDDWGSIRTRSKKDFEGMLSKGLGVDYSNFTLYDCLESNTDLENLFELLLRYKDSTCRPVVFTPMCIMANPDFDKIRESSFQQYFYESFTETCKKYPDHDKVHLFWKQGINERLFVPGFHGREHLNVSRWMNALRENNPGLLIAFEHKSIGAVLYNKVMIPEYLGAFHPDHESEIGLLDNIIKTGAVLFKENCGYYPIHFIAPNRESAKPLDLTLSLVGVKYLTISKIRHYPKNNGKTGIEINWLGRENRLGQIMITRNCHFEPSDNSRTDWVDSCLKEIDIAFRWKKPAIISTHRVNYIGFVNQRNRDEGLKRLEKLLSSILIKWPEVEFLTSSELGSLISNC